MDKIRLLIFISVLGGLIYFGFIYDSDHGVINDEYLSTESYKQLEEEIIKEQKKAVSNLEQVKNALKQVIKSDRSKQLELPVDDIAFLKEGKSDWHSLGDLRFLNVGTFEQDSLEVYFVLFQKPGMYDEAGLIVATAQENSLIQFKTIGQFKDSVAEEVKTQIYLKAEHVVSTKIITRKLYPVEQENITTLLHTILETGEIKAVNQN